MVFTKRLREGIRRGRIRSTIRIWKALHVKIGGRYPMDDGHVVVDAIEPIRMRDITGALARSRDSPVSLTCWRPRSMAPDATST